MLKIVNKQTVKAIKWADPAAKLLMKQLVAQNWLVHIDEVGCVVSRAPKFPISIKSSDFSGFKGWIKALKLNGGFDDSKFNDRISQTQSRIEVQNAMTHDDWKNAGCPKWKVSTTHGKLIEDIDFSAWTTWQGIVRLPPFINVWCATGRRDLDGTFNLRIETLPIIKKDEIHKDDLRVDSSIKDFKKTYTSRFNLKNESKIDSVSNYSEYLNIL